MRILFTTSPGLGHMFPVVSLAWAARAAGHEVLVVTADWKPGQVQSMANAGLPVVEALPAAPLREVFFKTVRAKMGAEGKTREELLERAKQMAKDTAKGASERPDLSVTAQMYGPISTAVLDGVLDTAEQWRPDLIVHTPFEGAGLLAAAKLGIPAVEQNFGFIRSTAVALALRESMDEAYRAHGVAGLPERMASLEIAPPSMALGEPGGWPMRYVPFNGGGILADWLRGLPRRPRIALTLGTVMPGWDDGLGPLSWVPGVAKEVDAEFVLTVGEDVDLAQFGELPENVRLAGYVPLSQLLATCSAVVHHGGAGSVMTSLDAGIPQLVLPQAADHFSNAHGVAKRGCGLSTESGVDAELIGRLLTDDGLRSAAAEVRAEMHDMPSPAEVLPRLIELAG